MSATNFTATFARRFACTINLISGREFDSSANASEAGGSCVQCGGCDRDRGVVGVVSHGVLLLKDWQGLSLRWLCPGCGHDVTEETTLLGSFSDAAATAADPLCHTCRRGAR